MRKRTLSTFVALCLMLSLLPISAFGADAATMASCNIEDTIVGTGGTVYALNDSTNSSQTFSYSVPTAGATVLIFFRAESCTNSVYTFQSIANSDWVSNSKVNIVAVESSGASKETTQQFMDTHTGTKQTYFDVYYGNSSLLFSYSRLVYNSNTVTYPFVLIITNEQARNHIRYASMGMLDATVYGNSLATLISTIDSADTVNVSVTGTQYYDYAYKVYQSVNDERTAAGVSTLTLNKTLTEYAIQRAAEIALYYDHIRPNGTSYSSIFDNTYGTSSWVGENIAYTDRANSPTVVMNAWMNSTGHKANILDKNYTQIGVGSFASNGVVYYVQLFGNSTTNTEELSAQANKTANVTVSTLTSHLSPKVALNTSQANDATISKDETATFYLTNLNTGSQQYSYLVPTVADVKDTTNPSLTIATASAGADGTGAITLSPTAAGSGTVYFKAYSGEENPATASLTVLATPLTASMFTVNTDSELYNGEAKIKSVTSTLSENTDYSILQTNNINAGTSTITITGKGLYSGTLTYQFSINKAERALSASVEQNTLYLSKGARVQITDNAATETPIYTYASSNTNVATIDENGNITPTGEGSATITVTSPATSNYTAGTATTTITVTALPTQDLTFPVNDVVKTYGDDSFTYTATNSTQGGGSVTYTSSDPKVAVVDETSGSVTVVGVGTATISATAAQVDGQYAQTTVHYSLTVNAKELSIASVSVDGKTYDKTTSATVSSVTFNGLVPGETLSAETDYTVSAEFSDSHAGEDKPVTVTVTMLNSNYHLSDSVITTTATISKATLNDVTITKLLEKTEDYTGTIDLTALLDLPKDETITFTLDSGTYVGLKSAVIENTTLTMVVNTADDYSAGDTVTIHATGMTNYTDTAVTVKVTYVDKTIVDITGIKVATGLVYDGTAQNGYIGTPVSSYAGDYEVTYSGYGNTTYGKSELPPTDAGQYIVTIQVPENNETYVGSTSLRFTIEKASITITADDQSVYVGHAGPTYRYTIAGLAEGEELATIPTLSCDADLKTAGTYIIVPTGAIVPNENNYNREITYVNGTLTVKAYSSSSSGGNSSDNRTELTNIVTVPAISNGMVTTSSKTAAQGATVTLTVSPSDGYVLDKLTVNDAYGSAVALTKKSDTQYTFTMPASQVTVNAAFVKEAADPAPAVLPFTDVASGDYFYDAVAWAVEQGITTGTGTAPTTFSPDASCTRAQMVTFLWRAAGSPTVTGENPFTDVSSSDYYYDAVLWAVEKNITNGTSPTTFSPEDTVTRGQTVTFLYRNASSPAVTGISSFTDVDAAEYYAPAVLWAASSAITTGTTPTTFSPEDDCTRAQIVTFLYRDLA